MALNGLLFLSVGSGKRAILHCVAFRSSVSGDERWPCAMAETATTGLGAVASEYLSQTQHGAQQKPHTVRNATRAPRTGRKVSLP